MEMWWGGLWPLKTHHGNACRTLIGSDSWRRRLQEVAVSAPVANTVTLGLVCHGLQRCANKQLLPHIVLSWYCNVHF